MKIIQDKMVSDYESVKRTWRERLFSWPWKPWKKFNSVYNPKVYSLKDGTLVMSPASYRVFIEKNLI